MRRPAAIALVAGLVASAVTSGPVAAAGLPPGCASPVAAVGAWGLGIHGQLGNGTTLDSGVPTSVRGVGGNGSLTGVLAVATGGDSTFDPGDHSLALRTDGSVAAWGYNIRGQLGNGTGGSTVPSPQVSDFPLAVSGVGGTGTLRDVTAIAAGGSHSLALRSDGSVVAWGDDLYGELGNGKSGGSQNGALAGTGSAPVTAPVAVLGVGGIGTLGGIVAIAAGGDHSLALRADGSVLAWGKNNDGQLGIGVRDVNGNAPTAFPVAVHGVGGTGTLGGVVAIAAGYAHSMALRSDGTVVGWGSNGALEIGTGSPDHNDTASRLSPVVVAGVGGSGSLSGVAAIAAGNDHSVALRQDGSVVTWGSNGFGQLGTGDPFLDDQSNPILSSSPVPVRTAGGAPLSGIAAISAGSFHTLGRRTDGGIVAWGGNSNGQLGDGSTVDRNLPVTVLGPTGGGPLGALTVSAGRAHSLVVNATSLGSASAVSGTPQTAMLGNTFAAPLKMVIRSPAGTPVSGVPVTFSADDIGALSTNAFGVTTPNLDPPPGGSFAGGTTNPSTGVNSVIVTTDAGGIATAPTFTANLGPGSFTVRATAGTPVVGANFPLTNTAGPLVLSALSGTPQSTLANTGFAAPLSAIVQQGTPPQPVAGVSVVFTAPSVGAGGTFSGPDPTSTTVVTDAAGVATTDTFTANGVAGVYSVTAKLASGRSPDSTVDTSFTLTNMPPLAVSACAGNGQSAPVGRAFATPLRALVTDAAGQPLANRAVTFHAPTSGPSGAFPDGGASAVVATDSSGIATAPAFTAGPLAGPYSVQATTPGADGYGSYSLTNVLPPATVPALSPAMVSFGNQPVGVTTPARAVSVTNTGGSTITIHSISASPADYGETNDCGPTLAPGASCTVSVSFTPATTGLRAGSLAVSDDSPGSPQTVALLGNGLLTLGGDASAIRLEGVTLLGGTASPVHVPDGGQGICEAGPVAAATSGTVTGTGLPSCSGLGAPGLSHPLVGSVAVTTEIVVTQGGSAAGSTSNSRSTVTSMSLLPGFVPAGTPLAAGADLLDVTGLDAEASVSCVNGRPGAPTGHSSIASLSIAGTRVATQPVGSRIIFNPTGKNPITLYGNPIWINPMGGRIPMAIVTLNYSRYDPATNSQVSSPLEVEFPAGGPLAAVITGKVFISYAQSGLQGCR